jgi:hypothetical protein
MAKRGKRIKPGQKTSYGHWPAITSPRRPQYPPAVEGKPWREPPLKFVVLPIPDKPYVQRRLYQYRGEFMIVDYYRGSKVVWESKIYISRPDVIVAHLQDTVTFVCQYPCAEGDTDER